MACLSFEVVLHLSTLSHGVDACIGYLLDFLLACIIYKSWILYHPMLTMWLEISSLAIKCMHASDTCTSNSFAEFCELFAREKWCSAAVQKINCFWNLYLWERVALGVLEFGYSESVITPLIFSISVNEISPSFRPWT